MHRVTAHALVASCIALSLAAFAAVSMPCLAQGFRPPANGFPNQPLPLQPTPLHPTPLPNHPFQPNPLPIQQPIRPGLIPSPNQNNNLGIFGTFTAQGMLIQRVVPGTPGARAGLKAGDLVMKLDNMVITNQNQLEQAIQTSGGLLQMIVRDQAGQVGRIVVDLTSSGCGKIRAPYMFGVVGVSTFQGFQARKVFINTPASGIGVKPGDFIVAINGEAVKTEETYYRLLSESAGTAVVDIRRGGQTIRRKVRLDLYRFGTIGDFFPTSAIPEAVAPFTPAANAGIKPRDTIVRMDNIVPNSQEAFDRAIDQAGGTVVVTVQRAIGGLGQVKVNVVNNSLGCWCEPAAGGMRILSVNQGQLAQLTGLSRGDIIFRVNRQRTPSLQQLQTALENARGLLTLDVRSGQTGQLVRLRIDLGG